MRVGLVQLNASDDPKNNLGATTSFVEQAAAGGAELVLTPEVTNCVSASRSRQNDMLQTEDEDLTLAALRKEATRLGIWVLIGSLALKQENKSRFVNRSFLISPNGAITARYDKIHMFDVKISETETYRESDGYQPGTSCAVVQMNDATLGMTICYDVRFPYLYRKVAKAGAQILTVPSAFTPETGAAHWEVLLRARAIENGCFVLAPAQCGTHSAMTGRRRRTYGHSLVVDPWGHVLADGGEAPGVTLVDLDLNAVDYARRRISSLTHDRDCIPL